MDMKIIITPKETGSTKPLVIDIPGYYLEFSGITPDRKLAISEESEQVNISLIENEVIQPVVEQSADEIPLQKGISVEQDIEP